MQRRTLLAIVGLSLAAAGCGEKPNGREFLGKWTTQSGTRQLEISTNGETFKVTPIGGNGNSLDGRFHPEASTIQLSVAALDVKVEGGRMELAYDAKTDTIQFQIYEGKDPKPAESRSYTRIK